MLYAQCKHVIISRENIVIILLVVMADEQGCKILDSSTDTG